MTSRLKIVIPEKSKSFEEKLSEILKKDYWVEVSKKDLDKSKVNIRQFLWNYL